MRKTDRYDEYYQFCKYTFPVYIVNRGSWVWIIPEKGN
ncbi:MAG: hypothetical protein RJA81_221 [Planctomycetota bacterium]|jgi:hypothetical protein